MINTGYTVPADVLQLIPARGRVLLVQQGEDGYGEEGLPLVGFALVLVHLDVEERRVVTEPVVSYFGRETVLSAVLKDYHHAVPAITLEGGRTVVAP